MSTIQIYRIITVVFVLLFASVLAAAQEKVPQTGTGDERCGMTKADLNPLIEEAEREEFNTRRVEIVGSTYTRDREFRKRMAKGLSEGDIFTRRGLEESVKRVAQLKTIYPISIENIEIRLDRKFKSADIVFCVRQKPKK